MYIPFDDDNLAAAVVRNLVMALSRFYSFVTVWLDHL